MLLLKKCGCVSCRMQSAFVAMNASLSLFGEECARAAEAIVKAFRGMETRRLTWRERLRPRWRIFQWMHDAWHGEATFLCGERLNLHRGAELEDWVAELFERE